MAAVLREQLRLSKAAIPRTLSDTQKESLREHLKPIVERARAEGAVAGINISTEEGWDSRDYALDFEDFLTLLGFRVTRNRMSGQHAGEDIGAAYGFDGARSARKVPLSRSGKNSSTP
jgi:hypothetical protein